MQDLLARMLREVDRLASQASSAQAAIDVLEELAYEISTRVEALKEDLALDHNEEGTE